MLVTWRSIMLWRGMYLESQNNWDLFVYIVEHAEKNRVLLHKTSALNSTNKRLQNQSFGMFYPRRSSKNLVPLLFKASRNRSSFPSIDVSGSRSRKNLYHSTIASISREFASADSIVLRSRSSNRCVFIEKLNSSLIVFTDEVFLFLTCKNIIKLF